MEFLYKLGHTNVVIFTDIVGSGSLRYQLGSGFKGSFNDRKAKQWKTKKNKPLVDAEWLIKADKMMDKFDFIRVKHTSVHGKYRMRELVIDWS